MQTLFDKRDKDEGNDEDKGNTLDKNEQRRTGAGKILSELGQQSS